MSDKVFLKRGPLYEMAESDFEVCSMLDDGVFQIMFDPFKGFSLIKIAERFHFGYKLYGLDTRLVNHVIGTYNKQSVKKNLGVLLYGAKGGGKTVTAKYMANKLGLPIVLVDQNYPGLSSFISSIDHDCIFFFDEFEKNFYSSKEGENTTGESLLSVMDGVYNSDACHIFILTANTLDVNTNLLNRPSRIRYIKKYDSVMSEDVLNELLDDMLKYPERREEIFDYIKKRKMCPIDVAKSIIDEINIHNCSITDVEDFFNAEAKTYHYYGYRTWLDDASRNKQDVLRPLRFSVGSEKVKENTPLTPKDEFVKNNMEINSVSQYINICQSSREFTDALPYNLQVESLDISKSFSELKVGEIFPEHGYKILEIDHKNGGLHSYSEEDGRHYWLYVENVSSEPNVFSGDNKCTIRRGYYI